MIYDSSPIDPKVYMNDKQDLRDSAIKDLPQQSANYIIFIVTQQMETFKFTQITGTAIEDAEYGTIVDNVFIKTDESGYNLIGFMDNEVARQHLKNSHNLKDQQMHVSLYAV